MMGLRRGDKVMVGDTYITIADIGAHEVRLGFRARKSVKIKRLGRQP